MTPFYDKALILLTPPQPLLLEKPADLIADGESMQPTVKRTKVHIPKKENLNYVHNHYAILSLQVQEQKAEKKEDGCL